MFSVSCVVREFRSTPSRRLRVPPQIYGMVIITSLEPPLFCSISKEEHFGALSRRDAGSPAVIKDRAVGPGYWAQAGESASSDTSAHASRCIKTVCVVCVVCVLCVVFVVVVGGGCGCGCCCCVLLRVVACCCVLCVVAVVCCVLLLFHQVSHFKLDLMSFMCRLGDLALTVDGEPLLESSFWFLAGFHNVPRCSAPLAPLCVLTL